MSQKNGQEKAITLASGNLRENIMSTNWRLWTMAAALMACFVAHAGRGICEETAFTRVDLATQEDHSWGDVQVGDLNGDGNLDIQAGKQWYEGPDWVRHSFGPNPDNKMGRYPSIADLDGDGDMDLVMRPIGFGGYRELDPKAQYDVTIFFQRGTGARP